MNSANIITLLMAVMFNVVTSAYPPKPTKCRDIPLQQVNYQDMIQLSPLYVFLTTEIEFHCSQIMFVGTAGTQGNYTGSIIVISLKNTITFDFNLKSGAIFEDKRCSNGFRFDYRMIFYKMGQNFTRSYKGASYCAVVCDPKGDSIQIVFCAGRTYHDAIDVAKYMRSLKTPILKTVYASQRYCPKPRHCVSFH